MGTHENSVPDELRLVHNCYPAGRFPLVTLSNRTAVS